MQNNDLYAGTLGGICLTILNIGSGDVLSTIALAFIGSVTSYIASVLCKKCREYFRRNVQ
jgi:Na+/alanine symporter